MWSEASVAQNSLVAATYLRLTPLVKTMIENGIKDARTVFGTAIECAIKWGDLDSAVLLLENGGSVIGSRCIGMAGKTGQQASLNLVFDPKYNNDRYQMPWFYLFAIKGAAKCGHLETNKISYQPGNS
jgi:hypothetical protein